MSKQLRLYDQLLPAARKQFDAQVRDRRNKLWGPDDAIIFRIRQYKFGDRESVAVVKQNYLKTQLYSKLMGTKVTLEMTRNTLRHVEEMGGLDEYLLRTPHSKIKSRPASDLKWQVSCLVAQQQHELQRQQQEQRASNSESTLGPFGDRSQQDSSQRRQQQEQQQGQQQQRRGASGRTTGSSPAPMKPFL